MTKSILVLGSSSWLGHYLIPQLVRQFPDFNITAAYHKNIPIFTEVPYKIVRLSAESSEELEQNRSQIILNLSRGEDDIDFLFHQRIIHLANKWGSRYLYASSSNALDFDVSKAHNESDLPQA